MTTTRGPAPRSTTRRRTPSRRRVLAVLAAVPSFLLFARHASNAESTPQQPTIATVIAGNRIAPHVAERVLALDADAITGVDVREILAMVPAPRIIGLHGSVPIVTMRPFAEFLIAMGYPQAQLRNPADDSYTYGSFVDPRELAGTVAWHYERDALAPLLIGHSQGGVAAIGTLHALAGAFGDEVPVFDPVAGIAQSRTTIIDPLSGITRSVVGLQVPFAAAIATGRLMRLLLLQWTMFARLRLVPDTVEEFTGFFIPGDLLAPATGDDTYRPLGSAQVRNVTLPAAYSHIDVPRAAHLAANDVTRDWIEHFDPRHPAEPPAVAPDVDARNIVHAAYIWHSVKRHWCRGAQRIVLAARRELRVG